MPEAKISQKYQIVIPKESRKAMGVKAGDKLIVKTMNGMTLLIPKPKNIARALRGIAKGTYPPNYLSEERKSWSK